MVFLATFGHVDQEAELPNKNAAAPTATRHIRARRRYGQLAETQRELIASAARARRTMAEVQSSSRSQQAYAIGAA